MTSDFAYITYLTTMRYGSQEGTETSGPQINSHRCYWHICSNCNITCSISITASKATCGFCWCKALDCWDRAFHVFTNRLSSHGEKVLLKVKLKTEPCGCVQFQILPVTLGMYAAAEFLKCQSGL